MSNQKIVSEAALSALASDIKNALANKADSSDVAEELALKANTSDVETALAEKANTSGEYDDLTVGNAKQLLATVGVTDKVPYNFRTSGGGNNIGDREIDKIIGGSVAWNQLAQFTRAQIPSNNNGITYAYTDGTSVKCNGTATADETRSGWFGLSESYAFKDNVGHKVIISTAKVSGTASGDIYFGWGMTPNKIGTSIISTVPSSIQRRFYYRIPNGTTCTDYIFTINCIDLTQMFGTTIADHIYSLEQATTGAGVTYFRKLFPKSYYAYNSGELMSVKTSKHITVGFNQFDEQYEFGNINSQGVNDGTSKNCIRSKNYTQVIPNTTYCFNFSATEGWLQIYLLQYDADNNLLSRTAIRAVSSVETSTTLTILLSEQTHYIRFFLYKTPVYTEGALNTVKTCINLSWSGYRNGEYEPYVKNEYPLDSDLELRGIPKLDSGNNLYYDGDEYSSDGNVKRRYGIVDLGSLSWNRDTTTRPADGSTIHAWYATLYDAKNSSDTDNFVGNLLVSGYKRTTAVIVDYGGRDTVDDKLIGGADTNHRIWLYNSAYNDYTGAQVKTALSGVYLIYEKATPTTETADKYQNPQTVNDFGTEEYLDTRAVAIPVGHETKYLQNLRDKIQQIPNLPTSAGTYKLVCTIVSGKPTYTWVADT